MPAAGSSRAAGVGRLPQVLAPHALPSLPTSSSVRGIPQAVGQQGLGELDERFWKEKLVYPRAATKAPEDPVCHLEKAASHSREEEAGRRRPSPSRSFGCPMMCKLSLYLSKDLP